MLSVTGDPNGTAHAGNVNITFTGAPVVAPSQPAPVAVVPDPAAPGPIPGASGQDQAAKVLVDIETILAKFPLRVAFNYKTIQFWAMVGAVAAIVMAWINVDSALSTAVQSIITIIGGVVVTGVTGVATLKTPVTTLVRHLAEAGVVVTRRVTPMTMGAISPVGYYPEGTSAGSVVGGGSDAPVAPPAGGTSGSGGTGVGTTDEGNVTAPGGSVANQQGAYSGGNAEPYAPVPSTSVVTIGNNSNEGTGGPAIGKQQGPYDQNAHTESPGSYTPPTPSAPNPDESGSHIFKAAKPTDDPKLVARRNRDRARRAAKKAADDAAK